MPKPEYHAPHRARQIPLHVTLDARPRAAAWRLSSDELGQIDRLAPLGACS